MTQEEVNATYFLVKRYLRQREEKQFPTAFDLLPSSDKLLALTYAKLVRKKAEAMEEGITNDLVSMQDSIGTLVSLEHRIKPFSSILEKTVADSVDYQGSFKRAANNICDSVRYTFVIPDDLYLKKVDECLHELEKLGYEVIDFKNKWGSIEYKGINVRIANKNKEDIFEIQFHTPFAYRIKEGDDSITKENSTRTLYKVCRDKRAPEWLRLKADKLRIYLQTFINIPDGAIDYRYDPEVKRR